MPMIGRQCTRDGRTVCLRMSQTGLPVNQEERGLTLVYGWASEERRAQGIPASIQESSSAPTRARSSRSTSARFAARSSRGARAASERPSRGARRSRRPHRVAAGGGRAPAAGRARGRGRAGHFSERIGAREGGDRLDDAEGASREARALAGRARRKLGLARSSVANYENGRSPLSQRLRKWVAKHEPKLNEGETAQPAAGARPPGTSPGLDTPRCALAEQRALALARGPEGARAPDELGDGPGEHRQLPPYALHRAAQGASAWEAAMSHGAACAAAEPSAPRGLMPVSYAGRRPRPSSAFPS